MGNQLKKFLDARTTPEPAAPDVVIVDTPAMEAPSAEQAAKLSQALLLLKGIPGTEAQQKEIRSRLGTQEVPGESPKSLASRSLHLAYQQALRHQAQTKKQLASLQSDKDALAKLMETLGATIQESEAEVRKAEDAVKATYRAVAPEEAGEGKKDGAPPEEAIDVAVRSLAPLISSAKTKPQELVTELIRRLAAQFPAGQPTLAPATPAAPTPGAEPGTGREKSLAASASSKGPCGRSRSRGARYDIDDSSI